MQKRTVKKIVFSKRFVDDSVLYSETYDQCETKKKEYYIDIQITFPEQRQD